MQKTFTTDDVTIRDVPPTPVAIMEHRGDPATLGATIQRFIAWRKAAGLHPKTSPTFNVWRSERRPASPADYSVDLCVGTDQPIEANGEQIKAGEIPGGRCAVLRVVGNTDNLEPAALYLYRDWLPASGEEARDFPIYCQRLSFFPEVPEHEAVAELFSAAEIAPSDGGLSLPIARNGQAAIHPSWFAVHGLVSIEPLVARLTEPGRRPLALDFAPGIEFHIWNIKNIYEMRRGWGSSRGGDRPLPRARLLRAGPGDVGARSRKHSPAARGA